MGNATVGFSLEGGIPETQDTRRKDTYVQTNLSLSGSSTALVLGKGGFHRSTGGRWVYVVSADGSQALRRDVRLGRQNPRVFEDLEGLDVDDVVITSSYDGFNTADILSFTSNLNLTDS